MLEFFENRVLAAVRPKDWEGGLGIDATIRAAVDAAEPGIRESFADQPRVEASIRNTLGQSYLYLGEAALAIRQFERGGGAAANPRTQPPPINQGDEQPRLRIPGRGTLRRRLALARRNPAELQGEPWPRPSGHLRRDEQPSRAYRETDRLDEALLLNEETLRRRKVTIGPDHPDTLASMSYVARTHWWAGRFAVAVPLYEETLKRRQAKLGFSHADTLLTMNDLATAYHRVGRLDDALPLLEETLKQRRVRLGSDHPGTLITMDNLASVYREVHRLPDALPLHEEALRGLKAKLGSENLDTLITMNNLISAYLDSRRWVDAERTAPNAWLPTRRRPPMIGGGFIR